MRLNSRDDAGNELDETHILKRDDGRLRVYWYRNDKLINELRTEFTDEPETKDPVQQAYDKLKARYPELYQYPPCYGVRASSSTLVGELMPETSVDVERVHQLASECGETFCFGLVGSKIAPLCPKP